MSEQIFEFDSAALIKRVGQSRSSNCPSNIDDVKRSNWADAVHLCETRSPSVCWRTRTEATRYGDLPHIGNARASRVGTISRVTGQRQLVDILRGTTPRGGPTMKSFKGPLTTSNVCIEADYPTQASPSRGSIRTRVCDIGDRARRLAI